jgi:tetratricopeptide (TPR) repeat protein
VKLSVGVILFSFLIGFYIPTYGQERERFINLLQKAQPDTNKVNLLLDFGEMYYFTNPDSCLILSNQALELARDLNFKSGMVAALNKGGEAARFLGEYPMALEMLYHALEMNKAEHDMAGEATSSSFIGFTYVEIGEYPQGLRFLFSALDMHQKLVNRTMTCFDLSDIGNAYELTNRCECF